MILPILAAVGAYYAFKSLRRNMVYDDIDPNNPMANTDVVTMDNYTTRQVHSTMEDPDIDAQTTALEQWEQIRRDPTAILTSRSITIPDRAARVSVDGVIEYGKRAADMLDRRKKQLVKKHRVVPDLPLY